jgi:hypothetical protein
VPSKASCPDPNTFYKDKNCNEVPCGPIPGGACCLELLGQCIERTYESACNAAGGAWYKGKLCDQLRQQGICKQPHGACCNVRSGECSEQQLITQCDLKWSTWWKDGSCSSDGYCSGSCCDTANGNCYQSKKADCSKPTQLWTIYGQCDPLKCPSVSYLWQADTADRWPAVIMQCLLKTVAVAAVYAAGSGMHLLLVLATHNRYSAAVFASAVACG